MQFSAVEHSDRNRGNGHNEHQELFFFSCEGDQGLVQVAQEEFPFLRILKNHQDIILDSWLCATLLVHGMGWEDFQRLLPASSILWLCQLLLEERAL